MLKMIFSKSSSFWCAALQCCSANIAVTTAILVVPLFLSLGVAVDYSRLSKIQIKMQDAADAASLAAAGLDDDLPPGELQRFVARFFKANGGQAVAEKRTRVKGRYRVQRVVVRAKVDADLRILGLFRPQASEVSVLSEAIKSTSRVEMAMVLDVTGSMAIADSWERTSAAIRQVLQDLEQSTPSKQFYLTLIPHTDRVNIGKKRLNWLRRDIRRDAGFDRRDWNGCVEPLESPEAGYPFSMDLGRPVGSFVPTMEGFMGGRPDRLGFAHSPCPERIVGPTRSLRAFMKALQGQEVLGGSGRFDDALAWGWRAVSGQYRGKWGAGSSYPDNSGESTKIVVWLTDGLTEIQVDELDRESGEFGYNMGSKSLFENVAQVCERMKQEEITVFIFHVIGNEHATPWFEECARENYFAIRELNEFETALQQLGSVGHKLQLVR